MRFRTYEEATGFIKALLKAKEAGQRELVTAKLDSVPQWNKTGKTPPPKLDGSRIVAVYLSYKKPTKRQVKAAGVAVQAGVELQVIDGRLVDVRTVESDGTTQVLLTNSKRNEEGQIPWRGPNIDKGILCYFAIDEGLGEPVEDIIARVPAELMAKLKAMKDGKHKAQVAEFVPSPEAAAAVPVPVAVVRPNATIEVRGADEMSDEKRHKLK